MLSKEVTSCLNAEVAIKGTLWLVARTESDIKRLVDRTIASRRSSEPVIAAQTRILDALIALKRVITFHGEM